VIVVEGEVLEIAPEGVQSQASVGTRVTMTYPSRL
jgi:hypothetical protein